MRPGTKGETFGIDIVEMEPSDLDQVIRIEKRSFPSPWSRHLFLRELDNELSKIFLMKIQKGHQAFLVGYICVWSVSKEIHILNLAIQPEYRRQGFASDLLTHTLDYYLSKGMTYATLEVRERNLAAFSLYRKFGFQRAGIRKGYYSDTHENAIVMSLDLSSCSKFR